jgi:predicted nucleotidyltransferase
VVFLSIVALRALSRAARLADRTAFGARLSRAGYRFAADVAARLFGRLDGVDGVYLTGSLTRPESLAPGYSDIDVVLAVNTASLADELRLRNDVARVQGRLNAFGPLFKNVDYVDLDDLDLYRRYGDAWSLDLDRRWVFLGGVDRREPAREPSRDAVRQERLVRALRRWFKAGAALLDPHDSREAFIRDRGAERLLADALAALTGRDRLDPLPSLLAAAATWDTPGLRRLAEDGEHVAPLARSLRAGLSLAHPRTTLLEAALEAIDRAATDAVRGGSRAEVAAPVVSSSGELRDATRAAHAAGFEATVLVQRAPNDDVILMLDRENRSAANQLGRYRGVLGALGRLPEARFPWARWPVLITPSMWRTGVLFEPSLDGAATFVADPGASLPDVWVPAAFERRELELRRRLAKIVRARGRRFRAHRGATVMLDAERAVIAALRDELAAWRREVAR